MTYDYFSYQPRFMLGHYAETEKIMYNFIKKVFAKEKRKVKVILYAGSHGFGICLPRNGFSNIAEITYDWKDLDPFNTSRYSFRRNVYNRDPSACNFSDITLSLLHEIGHFFTLSTLPKDYDIDTQVMNVQNKADTQDELDELYYALPSEYIATQWAIDWLKKKKNRLIAKQFEHLFFSTLSPDNE